MVWYHFPPRGTNLVRKKGTKTMLIKFEIDEKMADRIKFQYGQKVASRAFSLAAVDALDLHAQLKHAQYELQKRDTEIRVLRQTLEGARSAAVHLLEACGQGDMFNDSVPAAPPSRSRPAAEADETGTKSPLPNESMDHFLVRLGRMSR